MTAEIRADLEAFGVRYDRWFSERSLDESGALKNAIERLDDNGWVELRDGARWFRATELGDDKDRVLVRDNGRSTYFASDVAYLLDKRSEERRVGKAGRAE